MKNYLVEHFTFRLGNVAFNARFCTYPTLWMYFNPTFFERSVNFSVQHLV